MLVSDFHFDLPEDLIAQQPPAIRGSSRMLHLDRATGRYTDRLFADLPGLLQPGDLLILNDSRVLPARLFATRAGLTTQGNSPAPSGHIEVLLTHPLPNPEGNNDWSALVKPAKKVQQGETLLFACPVPPTASGAPPSPTVSSSAKVGPSQPGGPSFAVSSPRVGSEPPQTSPPSGPWALGPGPSLTEPATNPGGPSFAVSSQRVGSEPPQVSTPSEPWALDPGPSLTATVLATGCFGERTLRFAPTPDFHATLESIGHLPLPPYIHRDKQQPNTPEDRSRYQTVFAQNRGSAAAPTAGLHFTPEILAQLQARGVEIQYLTLHVGLGTFQPVRAERTEDIRLHAERYTLPPATAAAIARAQTDHRRIIAAGTTTTRTLEHIAQEAERTGTPIAPHSGETSIFLSPGHRFRLVQGLLTNFHLPQSTLLMLVSAFVAPPPLGRELTLAAYAHAVAARYRFFSYGDCMLIL